MKKLFTLALLAVTSLTACGQSFDKEVKAAPEGVTYHYVGGYEGSWAATEKNVMTATSVAEVAKLDKALAKTLAKKSIEHLYMAKITIPTEDANWTANMLKDGEVKEVNGKFTVKVIEAAFLAEEQTYTNTHWIPNPADTDPCHVEALTSNIFMPTYQKEPDEHGFSWGDNPVMDVEVGSYNLVIAKYTTLSSATAIGYGFGLVAAK